MKTTKHLNQDTFFQRVIAILVIVLLLTSILCINIKAINQRWHFTFDNIEFDLEASGWYAAYGGNISVTNEEHHSGNYSLKMTNRTKAWQSPALNLDRIFYEGGPGIYVFTVWVKVKNVNPYLRKYARSIVRGQELTSFIQKYDENYFGKIALVDTVEDTWTCIQGWISVQSQDIHKGTFSWMLDVIDPIEGQIVYIDDFDIFKSSDNPNPNQAQESVLNDKAFEKDFWYFYMPDYTVDEAAAWYYDQMASVDASKHLELVYTISETQANDLDNKLMTIINNQWDMEANQELIDAIQTAGSLLLQTIVPECAPIIGGIDIVSSIFNISSSGIPQLSDFQEHLSDIIILDNYTQTNMTVSIYLLMHDKFGLNEYQYKIVRSDGIEERGSINKDIYDTLIGFCNYYVMGTTFNIPSTNRILSTYNYVYGF